MKPFSTVLLGVAFLTYTATAQVQILPVPAHPVHGQLEPRAVSGDGNVVVGFGRIPNPTALVWNISENTIETIPNGTPAGRHHTASACSYDGSIVVGVASVGQQTAYRWTRGGSVELLRDASNNLRMYSVVTVNDQGTHVAGDAPFGGQRGLLWSTVTGFQFVSGPENSISRVLTDVSLNGDAATGIVSPSQRPFYWTREYGSVYIPLPQGFTRTSGISMNQNGDVLFATAGTEVSRVSSPFAWSPLTGTHVLDALDGLIVRLLKTNHDGRVVVGNAGTGEPESDNIAVIHTFGVGTEPLGAYFRRLGAPNPDSDFHKTLDVSNNANVFLGEGGIHPYWVAIIPPPAVADFNLDLQVTFEDLSDFLACYEGTAPLPPSAADLNRDGFTDFFDLIHFLDNF